MKRSDLYPKFKKFTPRLFWTRCEMCGEEFKKEPMIRIITQTNFYELCSECASSSENIKLFLKNPNMYNLNKTFKEMEKPPIPGETKRLECKDDLEFYRQPDE